MTIELKLNNKIENFVIVDTNSIVHRSFHAYDPQVDQKGNDQRVLMGIMDAIIDLSYKLPKIDNLMLVFDAENGSDYRKKLYPEYKANRPEKDEDLTRQKKNAEKILKDYIGLPVLKYSGFEADDAIGSISQITKEKYQTIVVSPDKDLAQLVQNNEILLMKKFKNKDGKGYKLFDEKTVKEDFGINPNQIPDWLALMGDTVDNLPGIKNIGEKTASKLISKYMSIEHLLAIVHEMEEKKHIDAILEGKDRLPLIKTLATTVNDLPIEADFKNALEWASNIRNKKDYIDQFIKIEKFLNWPEHYKDVFM